jgi:Spherulation-specific family 4
VKPLIPLYVHPLVDPAAWVAATRLGRHSLVVVNVHDGPGGATEPAYAEVTARLAAAEVPQLGYVDLDYGRRPDRLVRHDLAGWQRYPVDGVFFDRVPTARGALPAVRRAVSAAGRACGTVALNPGTAPDPAYLDLADVVCTFEGPWSTYRSADPPGGPTAAHLVYGVPADRLADAAGLVAGRAGYGLATGLDLPLPYLGLPYLDASTVGAAR